MKEGERKKVFFFSSNAAAPLVVPSSFLPDGRNIIQINDARFVVVVAVVVLCCGLVLDFPFSLSFISLSLSDRSFFSFVWPPAGNVQLCIIFWRETEMVAEKFHIKNHICGNVTKLHRSVTF